MEKNTSTSDFRSALNSSFKVAVLTLLLTSTVAAIHLYAPKWYTTPDSGRTQKTFSNSIPQYSHEVAVAYGILIPAVVAMSMFVSRHSKHSYPFTRCLIIISAALVVTDVFTHPAKGGRNHSALFAVVLFVGAILLRLGIERSRDAENGGSIG